MPRKGKSQRRVKDYARHYHEGADAFDRESLQKQRVKIPAFRDAQLEEELAGRERAEGMVTGLFPAGAYVRVGPRDLICSISGTFRPPPNASALTVGDDVTVAMTAEQNFSGDASTDKQRSEAVILTRQSRRSVLARPQPISGKRRDRYDEVFEKVVAANMDVLMVVATARQPRVSPALVDRFCIMAERGDMKPIVVFNKIDVAMPDEELVAELAEGNIPMHFCSAKQGLHVSELLAAIDGKRSVLAGPSGVGKSSLINAMLPGMNLVTGAVRARDERGRHTTAASTIHILPGGGLIIDTPGVRELALEMDAGELNWYFPEIAAESAKCKFNNCTHTHEPNCAVQQAAEEGRIPPRRYMSYLRIFATLQE